MLARLLGFAIVAASAAASAEEPAAPSPLVLTLGAGGTYGQQSAGVIALAGLGLHLSDGLWLRFEFDGGIGEQIGAPGERYLLGQTLALRDGWFITGAQHRAVEDGHELWGWMLGARLGIPRAPGWLAGLRVCAGFVPGTGAVGWAISGTMETDLEFQ